VRYLRHAPGMPALRVRHRRDGGPGYRFGATVASFTRFVTKLDLDAPASFFSAAWSLQVLVAVSAASLSHFFRKLVLAAPARFFSAA
jgi:hypothetical protein